VVAVQRRYGPPVEISNAPWNLSNAGFQVEMGLVGLREPGASAPDARLDTGETSRPILKPNRGVGQQAGLWGKGAKKRGYHAELVRQLRLMGEGEYGGVALAVAEKWLYDVEKCPGSVRCHGPCGKNSFIGSKCEFPLCPWCQARRSRRLVKRLGPLVGGMVAPKLWTFSPPNLQELTAAAVTAVGKVLTEMHGSVYFEGRVRGGVRVTEVTNKGRGWNLHAHEVVDSGWVAHYPQWDIEWCTADSPGACERHVAHKWRKATRRRPETRWAVVEKHPGLAREYSRICQGYSTLAQLGNCLAGRHLGFDIDCPDCWYFVDVRAADVDVVPEVTKYVVKGSQVVRAGPGAIVAFLLAFKGKRAVQTFGNLYNVQVDDDGGDDELPVRQGECPYDDCPEPAKHDWGHVQVGFPVGFSLDRNPETGTCRLIPVESG